MDREVHPLIRPVRRQLPVLSPVDWSALAAGMWAVASGDSGGRRRSRVHRRITDQFGASGVVLTDSGTSALQLALVGARRPDRPIAVPAYSCYDIATAVEGAETSVVLYDLDPRTLGPCPESLAKLRDCEPAAVVVCHLFGHLVDVDQVRTALGGVPVIEDAAQGVAGRLGGRRLGTHGSVSVLSFGRGKGLTGGSGGALLGNDDWGRSLVEGAQEVLETGTQARGARPIVGLAGQMLLGRPSVYGIPSAMPFLHLGETRYHPPEIPRPTAVGSLAVLARVLEDIDRDLSVRIRHAHRLERALARSPRATPMRPIPAAEPGYLRLPALLRPEVGPSIAEIAHCGVARGYPKPLSELSVLARRRVAPVLDTPGASALASRLVTLPTHALVGSRDLLAIENWLQTTGP